MKAVLHINNKLYHTKYIVFIGNAQFYTQALKRRKFLLEKELDPTDSAYTQPWKNGEITVWFNTAKQKLSISDISHEAVHVAVATCEYVGIPFTLSSNETLAYISGFFVEEVLRKLKKSQNI